MIDRNRAWRRKTTRKVVARMSELKNRFSEFVDKTRKKPERHHLPGKLSPVQNLKQRWALDQQLREGMIET